MQRYAFVKMLRPGAAAPAVNESTQSAAINKSSLHQNSSAAEISRASGGDPLRTSTDQALRLQAKPQSAVRIFYYKLFEELGLRHKGIKFDEMKIHKFTEDLYKAIATKQP